MVLATALASPARVSAADDVFDAINRLDGVKMFLLAALIGTAALAHRELGTPSWLRVVSLLAVLALLVSGVGYLVLNDLLANAAFVSGPLLLLWVSATGLALSRPRNPETVSPAASG